MKIYIPAALFVIAFGFLGFHRTHDAALLHGALTLGGGWLIATAFARSPKWRLHGVGAQLVLALLAVGRCAPAIPKLGSSPTAPYELAVFILSFVLFVISAFYLKRLRDEKLKKELGL